MLSFSVHYSFEGRGGLGGFVAVASLLPCLGTISGSGVSRRERGGMRFLFLLSPLTGLDRDGLEGRLGKF